MASQIKSVDNKKQTKYFRQKNENGSFRGGRGGQHIAYVENPVKLIACKQANKIDSLPMKE